MGRHSLALELRCVRAGLVSRFYVSISADICLYLLLLCAFMIRVRVPLSQVQNKKERERKKVRARIFHACFALLRLASVLTRVFPYPPRFLEHFFVHLSPHGLPTKNCS